MKKALMPAAILLSTIAVCFPAAADEPGSTMVGGKMYADLTWLDQELDNTSTAASGYGLDVKRFYLTIDHAFDETWSAKLTTDFNYVSEDGETQLYVKKAYVQAVIDAAATFRAGAADMPWIPFVEHAYGYRYLEKTITDRLGFANSADWGIHVSGKTRGPFGYQVSLVNGGGYKHPARSRNMDIAARASLEPLDGLTIAIGGYRGHRGKDLGDAPAKHTASRYDAAAAYVQSGFRLGAEYFRADDWNNVTTPETDSANGYSLFASAAVAQNLNIFARYDQAELSNDLNPSLDDRYYNLGMSLSARDNIDIAFAYKHENRSDARRSLETDEVGVWAQVTF